MKNIKLDIYDYLIMFCDYLSDGISERPCSLQCRISDLKNRYSHLSELSFLRLECSLMKLKEYLEKNLDLNIYKILEIKNNQNILKNRLIYKIYDLD